MAAAIDAWLDETAPEPRSELGQSLTSRFEQFEKLFAGSRLNRDETQIFIHVGRLAHTHQRGGKSRNGTRELQSESGIFFQSERRRHERG